MLWASVRAELVQLLPQQKVDELHAKFCRGSFDKELAMQVKLKNNDFQHNHLSFLQSHDQVLEESKVLAATAPEHALRLLQIKLQTEQANWKIHVASVRNWDVKTHKSQFEFQDVQYKLRVTAVDEHCSTSFGLALVPEVSKVPSISHDCS